MKVIILAGGGGTRLFPLSRTDLPKQFLNFESDKSLLGMTIERFMGMCNPADIVIVTGKKYYYQVKDELKKCGCEAAHIIDEPCARNSAPAIALGIKYCVDKLGATEEELFFVAPSDHIINPVETFRENVRESLEFASGGQIVTFGIEAGSPQTGYGYIKVGAKQSGAKLAGIAKVEKFVEKPDYETAVRYVADGSYYWNSGMFVFSLGTIQKEFEKHAPQLHKCVAEGTYEAFYEGFAEVKSISIDYAVAEKSENIGMIPLSIYWSDVGTWDSIYDYYEKDEVGNVLKADAKLVECKNSMFISEHRLVVGIGVEDIFVVDTEDVVLVLKKGESQKIKIAYEALKDRAVAHEHVSSLRPWGTYKVLSEGEGYKVKKICVLPGEKLSLQSHDKRSEHWVVISGEATVVVGGDEARVVRKNESVYVPKKTKHRLMNLGETVLEIIEVQNGTYVGEDDILRFEDVYGVR